MFIKEGIEVNSIFRAVLPDGTTKGESDSIYTVSNYEHEQYLNELKRLINEKYSMIAFSVDFRMLDTVARSPFSI